MTTGTTELKECQASNRELLSIHRSTLHSINHNQGQRTQLNSRWAQAAMEKEEKALWEISPASCLKHRKSSSVSKVLN
jgi:hypothetical protein